MHTFVMVLGGVGFTIGALFLIVVGSRALPRLATLAALGGLGLGYLVDGPWCAAFGAFVGLFVIGWAGTLVRVRRGRAALVAKGREPTWDDRYFDALGRGDFGRCQDLILKRWPNARLKPLPW